jgi:hypothetical protein
MVDLAALKARGMKQFNRMAAPNFPGPIRGGTTGVAAGAPNSQSGASSGVQGVTRAQSMTSAVGKGAGAVGGRAFAPTGSAASGANSAGGSPAPVYGTSEGVGGGLLASGNPIEIAEAPVPNAGVGQAAKPADKTVNPATGGAARTLNPTNATIPAATQGPATNNCPANTVNALDVGGIGSPAAPGANFARIRIKVDSGSSQVTILPFVMGDNFVVTTFEYPGGGGPEVMMISQAPCGPPVSLDAYWPHAAGGTESGQSSQYIASLSPAARTQAVKNTPLVLDAGRTYYLMVYQGTEANFPNTLTPEANTFKAMACAADASLNCNFGIGWQSKASFTSSGSGQ